MKSISVASALFVAVALAQPHGKNHHRGVHHKREYVTEVEWVTETEYVTQLIDATTTVWVTPGHKEAEPTPKAAEPSTQKKDTTTQAPAVAPQPTTLVVAKEPSTEAAPTTSTSIYTPPVEKPSSTQEPVVVAPESTTAVAPVVAPVETPAESKPSPSAISNKGPASGSSSSSGGSGSSSGDITYYSIGLGSCGKDFGGQDDSVNVVAMGVSDMGPNPGGNPNNNPTCGKTITIYANGKSTTAVVSDTCAKCKPGDIDVSQKVFMELWGSLDSGRSPCTWDFN